LVINKSFKSVNIFDLVLLPHHRLVNRKTKLKTLTNLKELMCDQNNLNDQFVTNLKLKGLT